MRLEHLRSFGSGAEEVTWSREKTPDRKRLTSVDMHSRKQALCAFARADAIGSASNLGWRGRVREGGASGGCNK
jgi:hypothetical protein